MLYQTYLPPPDAVILAYTVTLAKEVGAGVVGAGVGEVVGLDVGAGVGAVVGDDVGAVVGAGVAAGQVVQPPLVTVATVVGAPLILILMY